MKAKIYKVSRAKMTQQQRKVMLEEAKVRFNKASKNGVFECRSFDFYINQVINENSFNHE